MKLKYQRSGINDHSADKAFASVKNWPCDITQYFPSQPTEEQAV